MDLVMGVCDLHPRPRVRPGDRDRHRRRRSAPTARCRRPTSASRRRGRRPRRSSAAIDDDPKSSRRCRMMRERADPRADRCARRVRAHRGAARRRPVDAARRGRRAARRERRRQDHAAEGDQRADAGRPPATSTWPACTSRGAAPDELTRAGLCMVPEGRGVFPNLTVEENLWLASYAGRAGRADPHRGLRPLPAAEGAPASARGQPVRRRAADALAGARARVRTRRCCCSTSCRWGWRR